MVQFFISNAFTEEIQYKGIFMKRVLLSFFAESRVMSVRRQSDFSPPAGGILHQQADFPPENAMSVRTPAKHENGIKIASSKIHCVTEIYDTFDCQRIEFKQLSLFRRAQGILFEEQR